jgi:hypothetical protein
MEMDISVILLVSIAFPILLLMFLGNSLTITTVLRNKKLNTAPNQLIIGLAFSDILVCIFDLRNILVIPCLNSSALLF